MTLDPTSRHGMAAFAAADERRFHRVWEGSFGKSELQGIAERTRLALVRKLRQFGTALLLLFSLLAPVMACALPDAQMSQEEMACCRMMHGDCGRMAMSASHGCCQNAPQANVFQVIQAKTPDVHPVTVAMVWLAAWQLSSLPSAQDTWAKRPDASPPESPPVSITVLRI